MSQPLRIENVSKDYGKVSALSGISLELGHRQIQAIAGESGSGKTTLLRVVAGLETPDSGRVYIHGQDLTQARPEQRNVGLVFQEYALFPHLTVLKNISYGLRKMPAAAKRKIASDMLELVNLPGVEKRYPHQLSGGQQQRVAIARALAPSPSLLLFDEPFSNLDPIRRKELRERIRAMVKDSGISALIVTHDIGDALKVADQITILAEGRVVQSGTPAETLQCPANEYVAQLVEQ